MSSLTNWYLQGTTLLPTAEHLRTHVTKLAGNDTSATLTITFSDMETIALSHAQLSVSPLDHLKPFTTLKLDTTSHSFTKIRDFIYCTPVDLSETPVSLIKTARTWELHELYHACFLLAETAAFDVVTLVERFIPLVTYEHTPKRFKAYLAARIALDAPELMTWLGEGGDGEAGANRERFLQMLERGGMTSLVRKAIRDHSEVDESAILPCETERSKKEMNLFWEIPLGELLRSEKEYFESDVFTDGASGYVELAWGKEGARLIVGLQEVEISEKVDVSCCVIGMVCECADVKHNTGWTLEGGAENRSVDWVTLHEVEFRMFDDVGLKMWRETHCECRVRAKIRIFVAGDDGRSEDGGSKDGGSEDDGSDDGRSEDGGSKDGGSEDDGSDDGDSEEGKTVEEKNADGVDAESEE